jgi:hypothetical protein
LTSSPVSLQYLTSLSCWDPSQLTSILDVARSSPIATIALWFLRKSAQQVTALKAALRQVSLRAGVIQLTLHTHRAWGAPLPIDDEEARILSCLFNVGHLTLDVNHILDLQWLIPWLAMLPALAQLEVWILMCQETPEDVAAKLAVSVDLRTALPWVPEVELSFFSIVGVSCPADVHSTPSPV